MSGQLEERIARNEATFRQINENIERGRDAEDDATLIGFVCECGSADCARLIELTSREYEAIRSDPCQFAIVHDHDFPEVETVVASNERYAVVRKLAPTGHIAKETDPRA